MLAFPHYSQNTQESIKQRGFISAPGFRGFSPFWWGGRDGSLWWEQEHWGGPVPLQLSPLFPLILSGTLPTR